MSALPDTLSYYLVDFSDEVMPCGTSLPEWAAWLAKPAPDWSRPKPASDGESFGASVMRWHPDIVATRTSDGWSFSYEPENPALLACRFGEGLGWNPDHIVNDIPALLEWFAENDSFCEEIEHVAVGIEEPRVRVVFHAGPPATCTVEKLS